jgi:RNA polymerase sigma-70 factor (ECF subfamily)
MSDKELMTLYKRRPAAGLSELFCIYAGYVYAVARSKLAKVASAEDIEECTSDVFAIFYGSATGLYLTKGSVKSYLMVIAKRRAMYMYRKFISKPVFLEDINADYYTNTLCAEDDITISVEEEDERKALIAAVNSLGEPDTTIIYRRFYLGEPVEETARRVNLSESSVVKHTRKSLEKLRVILGGIA